MATGQNTANIYIVDLYAQRSSALERYLRRLPRWAAGLVRALLQCSTVTARYIWELKRNKSTNGLTYRNLSRRLQV